MSDKTTITYHIKTRRRYIDGKLYIEAETQIEGMPPMHPRLFGPVTEELVEQLRKEITEQERRSLGLAQVSLEESVMRGNEALKRHAEGEVLQPIDDAMRSEFKRWYWTPGDELKGGKL